MFIIIIKSRNYKFNFFIKNKTIIKIIFLFIYLVPKMSTNSNSVGKEILYKFPILGIEYTMKSLYFYANTIVN
jgi:hypothetical protein